MTGWTHFDEVTLGLQPGSLVVVAGRAGTGKTVAMMDWTRHACRDGHGTSTCRWRCPSQQMVERAVSAESCVELNKLREPGCLDDDQWDRVSGAISAISEWPLYIDTIGPAPSPASAVPRPQRKLPSRSGAGTAADRRRLPPAPCLATAGEEASTGAEEVGRFTRGLKHLARELEPSSSPAPSSTDPPPTPTSCPASTSSRNPARLRKTPTSSSRFTGRTRSTGRPACPPPRDHRPDL